MLEPCRPRVEAPADDAGHQVALGEDAAQPVTYADAETPGKYPAFRAKVRRILDGPLFEAPEATAIERALEPFDEAFAA